MPIEQPRIHSAASISTQPAAGKSQASGAARASRSVAAPSQHASPIALQDCFETAPVTHRPEEVAAAPTAEHTRGYKTVRLASRVLRKISNVAGSLPRGRGLDLGNYHKVDLLGPWNNVAGPSVFASQHVRSPGDATALGTFFDSRPDAKPIFLMGEGPFSAFCKRYAPEYFAFVARATTVKAHEPAEAKAQRIARNEAALTEAFNKIVAEGGIGCIYPDETIHHDGREEIRKSKGIKSMSIAADGTRRLPVWLVSTNYDSIGHKKPKAFLSLSESPVYIKPDATHEALCDGLTKMLVANETLDISKIVSLYLVKRRPAQLTKERMLTLVRDVLQGVSEYAPQIPVDPDLKNNKGRYFARVEKGYRKLQALGYLRKDGTVVSQKLIDLPDLATPQQRPSQRPTYVHLKDPVGHGAVREWQRAQIVEPMRQVYERAFADPVEPARA